MRDREPLAKRGEQHGIFQSSHGAGAGADKAVARGDTCHQRRRTLEAAAQDNSEGAIACPFGQRIQRRQHGIRAVPAGAEAARQGPMRLGEVERVRISEKIEYERAQAGPARGLGERAPGLGRDQDRIALPHGDGGRQPAISTASL